MTTYALTSAHITTDADRPVRKGFLRRLGDAMVASRKAKAEAEIRRLERALGRSLRMDTADETKPDFDRALLPLSGM
jgi:hypothetical protein